MSEVATFNDVQAAALRLLGRREHSRQELTSKLTQRGWPDALVESVLDVLADQGLQSDARHAEHYARGRAERGYGPQRIRAELQQRGIDKGLISRVLGELDIDWWAHASRWVQRRYPEAAEDIQERARRQQALLRRGYPHEMVRELVN